MTTNTHARAVALRPVIEPVFKTIAGVGLYVWLATITPLTGGGRLLLVGSVLLAIIALLLFRRRLVHDRWK